MKPRLDRTHLRLRLPHRDTPSEPRNNRMPLRRATFRERHTHPAERQPQLASAGNSEAGRHYAYDGVITPAVTVDRQRPAKNVRVPAKMSLPKTIGEHRGWIALFTIFF